MKILMTTDTVGGVWSYTLDLARELSCHGHKIIVATVGALPTPGQQTDAATIPNLHLCSQTYKLEWMDEPWSDVMDAGRWLLEVAYEVKPDVVHLNSFAHGALPWPAPVLVVGHSCVLSWWQAVHGSAAPERWEVYRRYARAGLQSADIVVAPTRAMLTALDEHYGPLRTRYVIYNGRRPEDFGPATKEDFIFSIGRLWDDAKNVAALEAVAPQLTWPIRVAGPTQHPEGGQRTLHHIHPMGILNQREISVQLSKAAIYALPARYEPFGLTVLEAAFSGCALVLGDIPTLRELWRDAALFIPPTDTDALKDALTALIDDTVRRRELADAAHYRAMDLTAARMAANYLSLYRLLIEMHVKLPSQNSHVPTGLLRSIAAPSLQ